MKMLKHTRRFATRAALVTCMLLSGVKTPAQAASGGTDVQMGFIDANLHVVDRRTGDADLFSRFGKSIYYTIEMETYLSSDKRRLMVDIFYRSYEAGGDYSSFTSNRTFTLHTAPHGYIIDDFPRVDRSMTRRCWWPHAGDPFFFSWDSTADVGIVVFGDQPGPDIFQGYEIVLGESWTVDLKRVGYVPPSSWSRFWR